MTSLLTAATSWSAAVRAMNARYGLTVSYSTVDHGLAALRELRLGVGRGDHEDVRRARAQAARGPSRRRA